MILARGYGLPVLLALALHALIAAWLAGGWTPTPSESRLRAPRIVNAELLVLERRQPKPPAAPAQRAPKSVVAPRPASKPAAQRQAPPPQDGRDDAQQARQREAERREERLARLAERAFEQALAEEAAQLANDAAGAAALAYLDGIYRDIVNNWSRPPSARNNMQAELLVELIPTGEVVSVSLLRSSGNELFDDSAERAVRKARRFAVPQDISLFEARFRKFTLLFKPEDLLR